MTQPRRHIAGQVALLTRRCHGRKYFLRPDDYINDVMAFEVGKAANRYGQRICAAVGMSNHIHLATHDTTANRSDFMRDSMSGIARSRNCDLERDGHFWESGSYGDTVLLDKDAIERKLLYIWLNPVRAGLVKRAEDWPGFMILPKHWGKEIEIEKPDKFYGRRNPDVVRFTPQPPPGYEGMDLDDIREHFETLLKEAEDRILKERKKHRRRISGVRAVLAQDPFDSPKTRKSSSRINPRFATKNVALMASAKDIYRDFLDQYEEKRQRWVKGTTQVKFPCGTLQLKSQAPISCKKVPDDEPGLFEVPSSSG